jgi:diphosphomevalonate decarboxylase
MTLKATAAANANIAIIKYWGRRDDRLRIPTNDSISFTMDERLQSTTTVEWVPGAKADSLSLDGSPAKENERARVSAFLDIVRGMMGKHACGC